jgi:MFS family permease
MFSKNLVFAAACLGMLLFGIVFLSLGSANNMLAERLALDDRAIGTLTALLPLGILLGSLVFGPVVDRFGYRWILVGASLLVGAALEGMAWADSLSLVQLCVIAIGFGGGVLNGATNALTADVSVGERGANLSLLGVFFGIGALTMPSAIASLSHLFPMEHVVAGIGTLALVPAAYCLAITFPPPKLRAEGFSVRKSLAMLTDAPLLFASLAMAVQSGMEGMSNDWMTRYLKNVTLGGAEGQERAAQLGLIAMTGGMLTRLVLARILKRVDARPVLFASVACTALGAALLIALPSYAPSLVGAVAIGIGLAAGFPVVLGYVSDHYPGESGTAFSTIFVIALLGNMAINKTFGYVAHHYGVDQYPKVLLALAASSAVLLYWTVTHFTIHTNTEKP